MASQGTPAGHHSPPQGADTRRSTHKNRTNSRGWGGWAGGGSGVATVGPWSGRGPGGIGRQGARVGQAEQEAKAGPAEQDATRVEQITTT